MPLQAHSEIYQGIQYLDTLGDIKAKFPNAIIENLNPAWATEYDALYSVRGTGLTGSIIIKFTDTRPYWRNEWDKIPPEKVDETDRGQSITFKFMNESDEEALTVEWVRWVPEQYIPLERYISKYGKPDKSGYSDDDMKPYKEWTSKGILVILSDDGKYVGRVDFAFTVAERRQAWKEKHGYIPDKLKEKKTQKAPTKKKK